MIKDDVRQYNRMMGAALVFYLAVTGITIFFISYISNQTGVGVEEVTNAYEANFLAKLFLNFKQFGFVLQFIIVPALGFAIYRHFRNKALKKKIDIESLGFYVNFIFFTLLMNVVNDIAVLLSRMIG